MARPEGIIRALFPFGEAADALQRTVLTESLPPARENFVGIGLVPHVEHQLVLRRIIYIM